MLILLPAGLMLMAGAFYWVRVRLTAEQLLPNALRDYLRQQADLDVQMERVQLGWTRLQAWNLQVHLPNGTLLGNARYLALAWQHRPSQQLQIQIERPRLLLARDAQGRWNIEPFLKRPPRRAAIQIPLELNSSDGILEFRDEFIRPRVVREMRLHKVQLRQPGSSMVVQARGDASDIGQVQLSALSDGERWRLNLAAERLRWAAVAPYLSKRMANTPWRIANGESALQLNLFYAPHQPVRLTATAQGALYGLRHQQTQLPWREIRFETLFTESLLTVRLHTPDQRLQASGTVEQAGKSGELRYALALQAQGDNAEMIERLVLTPSLSSTQQEREVRMAGRYTFQIQAEGIWTPENFFWGTHLGQKKFSSHMGWRDWLTRSSATGQVQLEQLHTPEGTLRQVQVPFLLANGQLRIHNAQANFAGGTLRAHAAADLSKRVPSFLLAALAKNLHLEQIPTLREQKLSGAAELQLLGEGTFQKPRLIANLLSDRLSYDGSRLGALRARLTYQQGTLQIPIAILQGAIGSVHMTGDLSFRAERGISARQEPRHPDGMSFRAKREISMNLHFSADEIDLNHIASLLGYREGILGYWEQEEGRKNALRLDGIAYVRGNLSGTPNKPVLQAQAAIFNGRLGDIGVELLAAQVAFQEGRILLPEITVYRRTAVAHASGEIELPPTPAAREKGHGMRAATFKLQGNLTDFDLATLAEWSERKIFLGYSSGSEKIFGSPIKLAGLANLSFQADGTADQFEIIGELTISRTQLDKLIADGASAQFHLTRNRSNTELLFDSAQVQLREGRIEGQMRLTLNEQGTHLHTEWRARMVPLQVFAPYLPADHRLQGMLNAEGQAQGTLDALHAEATWQIAQLNLNEVVLGEATGTAQWIPAASATADQLARRLSLQARLDAPDGRIEINSLRYAPGDGAIEAQGAIEDVPLGWIRQLALALPLELPPDIAERTDTLNGKLNTRWQLSGTMEKPQLAFNGRATHLVWNGQALGELQAQGNWNGEQLGFQLRWQAESTRLEAQGTLQEDVLNAEMELSHFPLEWVQLWEPSLPPIKGTMDLTLLATGTPDQPDLTLSATIQNLTLPLPSDLSKDTRYNPPYMGDVTDQAGRMEFVVDQLLFSRIDVHEGAIATEDALIQVGGYRARLSGRLPFHWSPLKIPRDEPLFVQLALRDQPLRVLELFLPIDAERTHGTLNAQLTIEGTLNELQPRGELQIADGSLALEPFSTYLQELRLQVEFDGQRARIQQARARSSASGRLTLTGEVDVAREEPTLALTGALDRFTVNEPRLPIGGSVFGRINGEVGLHGTLKKPQLTARLQVQDGFLSLPAEIQTAPGGFVPPLNPELSVQVQIARGFILRNPNLDARMEGALQIAGSIREPNASGTFRLQGGALNLPTARLRLEPESLIMLTYPHATPAGETIARLNLDVRATTTVIAVDYTGNPQRYRVELDIRGPLDDPERFQMVARSDPPGLSEQRILNLLGRGSALEALARGEDPIQIFRQQLSEMVTGRMLPGLLSPLETGIAEALGLEQFALDYTGIAPASVYMVKELFNGFGISYRRSLAIANPQYEVRLFYRLPFRNRFLQRLKLGWGFDNAQRQFLFIEGNLLFK